MTTYTRWNVADHGTRLAPTISNGNLTWTGGGTFAGCACRAFDSQSTGKYYFEINVDAVGPDQDNLGFVPGSSGNSTLDNPGGVSAGIIQIQSGGIYTNTATTGSGPSWTTGDLVCLAVDVDAGKVWFRKNGGVWTGSGTGDPAAGTNGKAWVGFTAPIYPMIFTGKGGQFTTNFGDTAFAQAVPSGFTAGWPGVGGPLYDKTQLLVGMGR